MFEYGLDSMMGNQQKLNELADLTKRDIAEMGEIKTDFDSQLFTVCKEGPDPNMFLASKFHFLMRQMRFSISESNRLFLDFEESERKIKRLETDIQYQAKIMSEDKFVDIEISRLRHRREDIRIDLRNQLGKTEEFEKLRLRLIEMNGKPFTNEQYQAEQTAYYTWFISDGILRDVLAKNTGISPGFINAHRMACGESILKDGMRGIESVINAVVGEVDLPQVVMNASGGKITKEQVLAAVKERQLEMIKQKLIAMSKGG